MASYVKFQIFPEHLMQGYHDLMGTAGTTANTCKIYLSNTAPNVATHALKGDLAEFAGGTGYTAGGSSIANVGTRSGGTFTLAADDVIWTAGAADWNAFRYVVLYNDQSATVTDALIAYWDYGAGGLTLGNGETFTVDFGSSVFTLA